MQLTNEMRAAIRSLIESLLAVAIMLGAFNGLNAAPEVLAGAIMLVVTNVLTVLYYVWKPKDGAA